MHSRVISLAVAALIVSSCGVREAPIDPSLEERIVRAYGIPQPPSLPPSPPVQAGGWVVLTGFTGHMAGVDRMETCAVEKVDQDLRIDVLGHGHDLLWDFRTD